jgi:hypothetical protein
MLRDIVGRPAGRFRSQLDGFVRKQPSVEVEDGRFDAEVVLHYTSFPPVSMVLKAHRGKTPEYILFLLHGRGGEEYIAGTIRRGEEFLVVELREEGEMITVGREIGKWRKVHDEDSAEGNVALWSVQIWL